MVSAKSCQKSGKLGIHVLNYLAEDKIELKNNTINLQCDLKGPVFLVSKAFVFYESYM